MDITILPNESSAADTTAVEEHNPLLARLTTYDPIHLLDHLLEMAVRKRLSDENMHYFDRIFDLVKKGLDERSPDKQRKLLDFHSCSINGLMKTSMLAFEDGQFKNLNVPGSNNVLAKQRIVDLLESIANSENPSATVKLGVLRNCWRALTRQTRAALLPSDNIRTKPNRLINLNKS